MIINYKCPDCLLNHQTSGIKSCYKKKISSDLNINHLILDNNSHLVRSNQEISFFFSRVVFWIENTTYERYYVSSGLWYHWSLQYDMNAIFNQQIFNNCQLENIPLGYGQVYLKKIQRFFKRRIIRKKYLQLINIIITRPKYLNNIPVPESMLDNIITFL